MQRDYYFNNVFVPVTVYLELKCMNVKIVELFKTSFSPNFGRHKPLLYSEVVNSSF